MCADSAIGCHQIHNQNTERDTIQWKHSATPSSFKMGNLESTTTPTAAQLWGITKWLPPLHCKPLHSQHSTIQTTQINSILRSWNISESFQSIIMELVISYQTAAITELPLVLHHFYILPFQSFMSASAQLCVPGQVRETRGGFLRMNSLILID